jgi:hypothetical protein
MSNSERVLNRKVQVLIKIAPPYFISDSDILFLILKIL